MNALNAHDASCKTNSTQKEKNNIDNDNGNSGAAPASGSIPDGGAAGDATGSGGADESELNPAERSLLQKVHSTKRGRYSNFKRGFCVTMYIPRSIVMYY